MTTSLVAVVAIGIIFVVGVVVVVVVVNAVVVVVVVVVGPVSKNRLPIIYSEANCRVLLGITNQRFDGQMDRQTNGLKDQPTNHATKNN